MQIIEQQMKLYVEIYVEYGKGGLMPGIFQILSESEFQESQSTYNRELIIFWVINFTAMLAHIPDRVGGSGPLQNNIIQFGYTQIKTGSGSIAEYNSDNTQVFEEFDKLLSDSQYTALQTTIGGDVGSNASRFFYDECNETSCTFGEYGPVVLVTYRNRQWNRPIQGSNCNLQCSVVIKNSAGSTLSVPTTIPANHMWRLDPFDSTSSTMWTRFSSSDTPYVFCEPFKNQPGYTVATAVSIRGMDTSGAAGFDITCTIDNLKKEATKEATVSFA